MTRTLPLLFLLVACAPDGRVSDRDPAVRAWRATLELDPCDAASATALGETLAERGKDFEALAVYHDFAAECRTTTEMRAAQLELEATVGDPAMALAISSEFYRRDQANEPVAMRHAELLIVNDRAEEAVDVLRALAVRDHDDIATLRELARAQVAAADPCAALRTWSVVWATAPDARPDAREAIGELSVDCPGEGVTATDNVLARPVAGESTFPVRLDGQELWLTTDQSALYTYVRADLLAGLGEPTGERVRLDTAYGPLRGAVHHFERLELGAVEIGPTDVVLVDSLPGEHMGSLGLEALARVDLRSAGGGAWSVGPP